MKARLPLKAHDLCCLLPMKALALRLQELRRTPCLVLMKALEVLIVSVECGFVLGSYKASPQQLLLQVLGSCYLFSFGQDFVRESFPRLCFSASESAFGFQCFRVRYLRSAQLVH